MNNFPDAAQQQFIKMTQSPLRPLILGLAMPTICSMLITSFYNMADTFFVARIGTSAAGAHARGPVFCTTASSRFRLSFF